MLLCGPLTYFIKNNIKQTVKIIAVVKYYKEYVFDIYMYFIVVKGYFVVDDITHLSLTISWFQETQTHFVLFNENPWSIIAANVAELGVMDVKPDF